MFRVSAATLRIVEGTRIVDPEAAAAYQSLEQAIAIGADDGAAADVRRMTRGVLRSYAQALNESQPLRRKDAWATFVRRAALLCFAYDSRREHPVDPRGQQAAHALRQIVFENADLLAYSSWGEVS